MARKSGKQYQAARKQVEAKDYLLEQAIPLIKKIKYAKFDETVEVHMRLGVDRKHADQMVPGRLVRPERPWQVEKGVGDHQWRQTAQSAGSRRGFRRWRRHGQQDSVRRLDRF